MALGFGLRQPPLDGETPQPFSQTKRWHPHNTVKRNSAAVSSQQLNAKTQGVKKRSGGTDGGTSEMRFPFSSMLTTTCVLYVVAATPTIYL
jgi:hypothetical protein